MRVDKALEYGREVLKGRVDNPQKEASLLLCSALSVDRTWLIVHNDRDIEDKIYKEFLQKRALNVPLEYITKKVSFYSKDFFVEEGVLIPRPETELLVDIALSAIDKVKNPKVLEVGVGSGIIAITLALLNPNVEITASDISLKALEVAHKNACKFGVDSRIQFSYGSFDDGVEGEFDLLVSNPPYIAQNTPLEAHVLNEPHLALFGGEKGHEMLEKLLHVTKRRGIKNIACEMGYDQREVMEELLQINGAKEVNFYKDLAGLDRGFLATF